MSVRLCTCMVLLARANRVKRCLLCTLTRQLTHAHAHARAQAHMELVSSMKLARRSDVGSQLLAQWVGVGIP